MNKGYSETDMYEPLKRFFVSLGYNVNGEVKNCDVTLLKEDHLIVIELKKSFTLGLLFQALDRQTKADEVYVAVPRLKNSKSKQYKDMVLIVKKLGLGLITIAMDSPVKTVEILVFPEMYNAKKNEKKKSKLVNEITNRTFDLNQGGSTKRKLMTAYREKVLKIACTLEVRGPMKASELIRLYGCDPHSWKIMHSNNYGWFQKCGKGIFTLSQVGQEALEDAQFKQLTDFFRQNLKKL